MSRPLLRAVSTVVLGLSVAIAGSGCGGSDVTAADPSTSAVPSSPTVAPEPTLDPSGGATTPPSEGLQKVRVVGEVVQVGDCVVVRADNDITWTIAGDLAAGLLSGDRVQVTGAPDLRATGCGGPLVTAVRVTVLD